MMKIASVVAAAGLTAGTLLAAAPVQASTSNVGWWQPGVWACSGSGVTGQGPYDGDGTFGVSVAPVVITNASSVSRTGSFTIPGPIASAVQVVPNINQINCDEVYGALYEATASTTNFTVAPGETVVMWVGLGTGGNQTSTESHNIGFGGLPSGTPGAAWYDMGLTLNNAKTMFSGGNTFNNLTATYQNTGGIDLATNRQDGFVLTSCQTMPNGSIFPSNDILTPYNNGAWTQGPTYQAEQPICAAWMPEGTYVSYTQGPSTAFTVQAAQTYGSGNTSVAMAGSGTTAITSATVSINGGAAVTVPVGGAPQSGMWVGQDPATKQWFLANAVASAGQTVALSLNGSLVGTVNVGP